MTYCEDVDVPNQANNLVQVFQLNSIFAPNYNQPPPHHQPRGHDQWQRMYKRYCVVGATVKAEPLWAGPGATGVNTSSTFFGHLDDAPGAVNYSVPELIELGMGGKSKYATIGGDSDRSIRPTKNPTLYWKVGMKKFFGVKKATQVIFPAAPGLGDNTSPGLGLQDNMTASFGTNPINGCYLKLAVDDQNASSLTPTFKTRVTIRYTCVLYDPIELPRS